MENKDIYVVDGFSFRSKSEYERALKENETIKSLISKIDIKNPEELEALYIKLVSKRYFQTPVGLSFLYDLRRSLIDDNENISVSNIPVPIKAQTKAKQPPDYGNVLEENIKLKGQRKKLIIAVVAMCITIIGMFFIVLTNDNLGYFNAEEKVVNKYSQWQEQLEQWEETLLQKEHELDENN